MIMVEFDRANSHRPAGAHYQSHHGSPHLQHLDRHSAHSTPSPTYQYATLPHPAAQQQQQQQQQQPPPVRSTPTSYPSTTSYSSPSTPAYPYSPHQGPQRSSPYPQPSTINLPPIRLNPPPPQLPQPHDGSPLIGSPLPPHPQPPHGYYPHALPPPAIAHNHITSSPIHQQPMRYPLPSVGNQERIMSGGRHKKEIKRRTKTGCLTCRKRRIKCDEAHPTCKNCQKSKRDCLGYDPIFKSQPGPAAIQPAPSGGSTPLPSSVATSPDSYSYAQSAVGQSYGPPRSTASSPASSCDTYEYPQIDPSLDATSHPHVSSAPPSLLDSQTPYRPELKRPLDRVDRNPSPFSTASDTNTARTPYTPIPRSTTPSMGRPLDSQTGNPAKRIKIDDLLSVGSAPPPLSPPASDLVTTGSNAVESMKNIYKSRYAPAVDKFLEVAWFASSGVLKIQTDNQLAEVMAEVFERLKARGGSYFEEEDPAISKSGKDTDLLWAAVRLCYGPRIPISDNRRDDRTNGERNGAGPEDDQGVEALRRIKIVERLLTDSADSNPNSPQIPPSDQSSVSVQGSQFWLLLEQIASFKITSSESEMKVQALLKGCERYVDGLANRRLLHAIAAVRYLRGDALKQRNDSLRQYIQEVANDRSQPNNRLERRIAGRAMGIWTQAVTETPFCML